MSVIRAYTVANINDDDLSCENTRGTRWKCYANGKDIDEYASTLLWSSVEVNVGIICACMPVLRPVLKKIFEAGKSWGRNFILRMYLSRKKEERPVEGAAGRFRGESFRRLDEDIVSTCTKPAFHYTWVRGGHEPTGWGEFEEDNRVLPVNAIYVQQNFQLTSSTKL